MSCLDQLHWCTIILFWREVAFVWLRQCSVSKWCIHYMCKSCHIYNKKQVIKTGPLLVRDVWSVFDWLYKTVNHLMLKKKDNNNNRFWHIIFKYFWSSSIKCRMKPVYTKNAHTHTHTHKMDCICMPVFYVHVSEAVTRLCSSVDNYMRYAVHKKNE